MGEIGSNGAMLATIADRLPNLLEGALVGLAIGGALWLGQALKQKTPTEPKSDGGDTETQGPTLRG